MAQWTYRCYDDGKSPDLWRRWYDANPDIHGTHDSTFDILEQQDRWAKPHCDFINKDERLLEIRLNGKVKFRIFGYYDLEVRKQFVVLGIGNHKGPVYSPKDILKTIILRKKEVLNGAATAHHCPRPQ